VNGHGKVQRTGYKDHASLARMITIEKLRSGNKINIGKRSFVSRTIKLWNNLPVGVLATFSCGLHSFKQRARDIILKEVKDLKSDD
jgi:hypothetical protein